VSLSAAETVEYFPPDPIGMAPAGGLLARLSSPATEFSAGSAQTESALNPRGAAVAKSIVEKN
jgi:hypothetical protein